MSAASVTPSAHDESTGRLGSILFFLVIAVAPLAWYKISSESSRKHAPALSEKIPSSSNWYLAVKVPEVPFNQQESEAYKQRFGEWLSALQREHFHPMLLSEVYDHFRRGLGLPEKTIVLVFEPGFAHTYDILSPILSQHQFVSEWITNGAAIKRSDRRYVTTFRLRQMRRSGQWDIGVYDDPSKLTLRSREFGDLQLTGDSKSVWSVGPVSCSLNQAKKTGVMNRLKANRHWTADELLGRLLNEVPVRQTVQLSAKQIPERSWGIALPTTESNLSLLNLKTPLDKRAVSVSWPGTAGLNDYTLQIEVPSLVGELWFMIRSDRQAQRSLRVGFTEESLILEQEIGENRVRLSSTGISRRHNKPLVAGLEVTGSTLRVSVDGNQALSVNALPPPSAQGILEMMVYNKIRGTAEMNSARLILSPLSTPNLQEVPSTQ